MAERNENDVIRVYVGVYSETSKRFNGLKIGGYSFMIEENMNLYVSQVLKHELFTGGDLTSNKMMLKAMNDLIEFIKNDPTLNKQKFRIITTNSYVCNSLAFNMYKWREYGWQRAVNLDWTQGRKNLPNDKYAFEPVSNVGEFQNIFKLMYPTNDLILSANKVAENMANLSGNKENFRKSLNLTPSNFGFYAIAIDEREPKMINLDKNIRGIVQAAQQMDFREYPNFPVYGFEGSNKPIIEKPVTVEDIPF